MAVDCEKCGHAHADWVPKERLDRVSKQRRDAASEVEQLKDQLATAETAAQKAAKQLEGVASLQTQIEQFQAKEAAWNMQREMVGAGLTDPEGADFAMLAYGRIPADKRPEGGIAAWLGNRDGLPKAVLAYMPEVKSGGETVSTETPNGTPAPPAPGQGTPPVPLPNENGGVASYTDAPGTFGLKEIAALGQDLKSWEAQRGAVWRALGVDPPTMPWRQQPAAAPPGQGTGSGGGQGGSGGQ